MFPEETKWVHPCWSDTPCMSCGCSDYSACDSHRYSIRFRDWEWKERMRMTMSELLMLTTQMVALMEKMEARYKKYEV